MNNIYSFAQVDKVSSIDDLPNPDDLSLGDTVFITHNIFRTGSFEHFWYGSLDFDRSYLRSIKNNFEKGVVPNKISMNVGHNRDNGAIGSVGWFRDLRIKPGQIDTPVGKMEVDFLEADVEYNSKGLELLLDQRYAHISAEIDNNYTTNEKYDVDLDNFDDDVQVEEKEDSDEIIVKHGPTLLASALTNHPFIPSLGEVVEFSNNGFSDENNDKKLHMNNNDKGTGIKYFTVEDTFGDQSDKKNRTFRQQGVDVERDFDGEGEDKDSEINNSLNSKDDNSKKENESNEFTEQDSDNIHNEDSSTESDEQKKDKSNGTDNSEVNSSKQFDEPIGDKKMEFAELLNKIRGFDDLEEQVKQLRQTDFSQFGEAEQIALEQMMSDKAEKLRKDKQLSQVVQEKTKLEKENEEKTQKLSELEVEVKRAKEQGWQSRVEKFGEELRNKGHHESVVKDVTTKLSDMTEEAREGVQFLSEDGEEKDVDMIEFVGDILASIPENARLDESEKLEANQENEVPQDEEQEREVSPEPQEQEFDEKDDEDDGVSFEERCQKYEDKFGYEVPSWVQSKDDIDEDGNLIVDED